MTQHIATAAVVKVSIGSIDGSSVARLVRRGDILPEGVAEHDLDRLVERGLIAELEVEDVEDEEATPEPYEGITVADLKSEIAKRNEGRESDKKIVPADPGNRPEIVAALVADDGAVAK